MSNKFKKGDTVFFIDKYEVPCQQHPLKGSPWESLGIITSVDNGGVIVVQWDNGSEYNHYRSSLRHKRRIRMFFRCIYDSIKETLHDFRSEISVYRLYRSFKKGDMVCLKHSRELISTCYAGEVVRKSFPSIVVYWGLGSIEYTHELPKYIEHYNGIDPNKLFKSYKRNMS